MQPKALISAEAKKSPIKDVSNYLNYMQYFITSLVLSFFVPKLSLSTVVLNSRDWSAIVWLLEISAAL